MAPVAEEGWALERVRQLTEVELAATLQFLTPRPIGAEGFFNAC